MPLDDNIVDQEPETTLSSNITGQYAKLPVQDNLEQCMRRKSPAPKELRELVSGSGLGTMRNCYCALCSLCSSMNNFCWVSHNPKHLSNRHYPSASPKHVSVICYFACYFQGEEKEEEKEGRLRKKKTSLIIYSSYLRTVKFLAREKKKKKKKEGKRRGRNLPC